MENNQNNLTKKPKTTIGFVLFRIIVVFCLIISLTLMKFLFSDTFEQVKKLYTENVSVNITAEYFKNAGGE